MMADYGRGDCNEHIDVLFGGFGPPPPPNAISGATELVGLVEA